MKKKLFIISILTLLCYCNNTQPSKDISIENDSLQSIHKGFNKENQIDDKIAEDQYIKDVFFQNRVNFLPIYISKDKFGDEFYGLDVLGAKAIDLQTNFNFYNGRFKKNDEFLRFDNFDRGITQKYYLDPSKRNLTLHYKDYNIDSKLVDVGIYQMNLSLKTYGIIAVDNSIIAANSGYGNYCGFVITNTMDEKISKSYISEILTDLETISNK